MNANMHVLMSVPGGQPFLHFSFAIAYKLSTALKKAFK